MTPRTVEVIMVMPASESERNSDTPIGSGAMREGGVRPKMSRYQKIDDAEQPGDYETHNGREDDADDRRQRPFQRTDLSHDDIAEQVHLAARQCGAGGKFPEHHHAYKHCADDDAGQAQRKDDLAQN